MNQQDANQVASRLKNDYVWGILNSNIPDWISVKNAKEENLILVRADIEELYEDMPASLPAGAVGGRMMLRYLNGRISKNEDVTKSLCIQAVCVYPKAVNLKWEDNASKKHEYVIPEKEMNFFPDCIRRQMFNWRCLLFNISGGKLSLDYSIQCSDRDMKSMKRLDNGDYTLDRENAKKLIHPKKDIMLYIFWVPQWGNSPRSGRPCEFYKPSRRFQVQVPHISLYTDEKRLKDPLGFVNLDGGLPHEFWHYIRYLACENKFKGFLPNDDEEGRPGWNLLKEEIALQGFLVPEKAHEEYYANLITWRFIKALKDKYDRSMR